MKAMNRRDFLKLSGASAIALAFVGCGSSGGAPATPTTGKEQKLYNAINAYLAAEECTPLIYSEGLHDAASAVAGMFKTMGSASIKLSSDDESFNRVLSNTMDSIRSGLKKAGYSGNDSEVNSFIGDSYGIKVEAGIAKLIAPYADDKLETQLEAFADKTAADDYTKEEPGYVGIATVEIDGVTYWIAAVKDAPATI